MTSTNYVLSSVGTNRYQLPCYRLVLGARGAAGNASFAQTEDFHAIHAPLALRLLYRTGRSSARSEAERWAASSWFGRPARFQPHFMAPW